MNFEKAFLGPRSIQVCHLRSKTPLTSVDCLRGLPRPIQRGRWPPRWLRWLAPFSPSCTDSPAGSARGGVGSQGGGSRRGSGGATWRGAPLERVRTGWAELARAHGGRGGAPRHACSRPPGRARLCPSPRRPAGAPPRAPAAEPSSTARARSLAVLLDVGVSINLGLARARHAAARMAELKLEQARQEARPRCF